MNIRLKKILLRTSILGGVFNCLVPPSYGMLPEQEKEKSPEIKAHKLKRFTDDITSLPSIERKINMGTQQDAMEPSEEDVERLHQDVQFLTPENLEIWIRGAEAGNLLRLYHLGWLLDQKEKTKDSLSQKDKSHTLTLARAKAFYWWKRAQHENDPEAWIQLALLYCKGQGVERDYTKALGWYLKAAEQNDATSQRFIGSLYERGLGVERDYTKALGWYFKAAEQDDVAAQCSISFLYRENQAAEKVFFEWLRKTPTQISKRWHFTDEYAPQIAFVLSHAKPQREISLSSYEFTSQGFLPILKGLASHPNLVELDISWNSIDDEGGKELLTFLEKMPSLKIDITGNPMSKNIKRSIKRIEALRTDPKEISTFTFPFTSCNFTDEDAPRVASLLSQAKPQRTINLHSNKFTSQGLPPILKGLASHPNLVELDISWNSIEDEGGKELLAFIEKMPSLKEISLYGNPMSEGIKRAIKKIELSRIDLAGVGTSISFHSKFTDEDAPQVASLLVQAKPLNKIFLSFNKFTSKGLAQILKGLHTHPDLVELDIRHNSIDDEGGKELLAFLKKTPSLKEIDVFGNPMSAGVQNAIKEALNKNNK
jgi:Ran GTPase-activating protein (RanGAP) involved in mRNA processing and transport